MDRQTDGQTERQRDRQSLTDGQRDKQMVDKKDTSITLQTCNEYCTCQSDSKTEPSYTNNESKCNVLITRCVTRQCARKKVPTFFSCNLVQSFAICHYRSVIFLDFSPMRHSTNNLLQMLDLYATALQEQYPKKIRFSDGRVRREFESDKNVLESRLQSESGLQYILQAWQEWTGVWTPV